MQIVPWEEALAMGSTHLKGKKGAGVQLQTNCYCFSHLVNSSI